MKISVETYSGHKADERPVRFQMGSNCYEVRAVLDQWYGPDHTWFKVQAQDGQAYVLRHTLEEDVWTLESLVAPPRTR